MKLKTKALALVLVFALMVTSIPDVWTTNAYAAGEASATKTNLISWDSSPSQGTVSGDTWTVTEEFKDAEKSLYSLSIATSDISLNNDAIKTAFGESSTTTSVTNAGYTYQWYMVDDKGNETEIAYEDESTYYPDDITNENDTTIYRCVITLYSVKIGNTTYDTSNLSGSNSYSLTKDFVYNYTGPTKEKIEDGTYDLNDYFYYKESDFEDEEINMLNTYYTDANPDTEDDFGEATGSVWSNRSDKTEAKAATSGTPARASVPTTQRQMSMNISSYSSSNLDVTWTKYYTDGTHVDVSAWEQENASYVYSHSTSQSDSSGKTIDYYLCKVDLKYGKRVLRTIEKKYDLTYQVFVVEEPTAETTTVISRTGAKKTFEIKAKYAPDYCSGVSYQWYKVDKDCCGQAFL